MDIFRLRLCLMLSPKTLALLLLIGGGGFVLISLFGEAQVAGFSLGSPKLEPIELMIKERLSGRYSGIASCWAFSTVAFFWTYIGRQLKKAERMI